jgi:hypothetical protein
MYIFSYEQNNNCIMYQIIPYLKIDFTFNSMKMHQNPEERDDDGGAHLWRPPKPNPELLLMQSKSTDCKCTVNDASKWHQWAHVSHSALQKTDNHLTRQQIIAGNEHRWTRTRFVGEEKSRCEVYQERHVSELCEHPSRAAPAPPARRGGSCMYIHTGSLEYTTWLCCVPAKECGGCGLFIFHPFENSPRRPPDFVSLWLTCLHRRRRDGCQREIDPRHNFLAPFSHLNSLFDIRG